MNTAQEPNIYIIMGMITLGLVGGIVISLFFEPEASPSDCVVDKSTLEADTPEGEEGEDEEGEDDEGADDEGADEDEDEDKADDEAHSADTDEEDRIVGRKINRIFVETIDSILEIRKAREARMAKRLKVE